MIEIAIPRLGELRLTHLVLDVNGTLALDGALLDGVTDRLARLGSRLEIHLITADTHGRQTQIDEALGVEAVRLDRARPEAAQKAEFVCSLGADSVAAIGNGANDVQMLRAAALAIAVLGPEGLALCAAADADVLAPDIGAALDLLLNVRRLIGTLRD